jgi:hypothetical protein
MLRISKTRTLILLCMVLMLAPVAKEQVNTRRDGNWWRTQSEASHYNYITGFMDGTILGYNFSYWNFVHTDAKCADLVHDSYNSLASQYFKNVTNDQLADGLTKFYEDYRNRRIAADDAVWLVLNEIAGTPKDVENWRKTAQ